jgi:hypothetical protein
MLWKRSISTGSFIVALLLISFGSAHAQVPHTVLGMLVNEDETTPAASDVTLLAYLIDVSGGGVRSETRTDHDTGNAYGNGVMGEGWFELECANFTLFEWAHGDSLRLAFANAANDQLLITCIRLDAAVEPQLTSTLQLSSLLQYYSGSGSSGQATVQWCLEEGYPSLAFHIFRSTNEGGPYQKINADPIDPDQPQLYTYVDYQVSSDATYWYKLGLADFSDSLPLFGPISVTIRTGVEGEKEFAGPTSYQLSQNYPNPFNPETTIRYQVPESSPVSLVIYNLLGQRVRTLVEETKEAGYHHVQWDGRDEWGGTVASGVYFYHMKAGPYSQSKKMTLLK